MMTSLCTSVIVLLDGSLLNKLNT